MSLYWDDTSEECPYGHLKTECTKEYKRQRRDGSYGIVRHCKIHHRELRKLRMASERAASRQRAAERRAAVVKPLYQRTGKLQEADQKTNIERFGNYTLVCAHVVKYLRYTVNPVKSFLWCARCYNWLRIHEVDADHRGEYGLIVWPLEVPESTPLSGRQISGKHPHVPAAI